MQSLLRCSPKAVIHYTDGHGYVPIKLYLQKNPDNGQIWPIGLSLPASDLGNVIMSCKLMRQLCFVMQWLTRLSEERQVQNNMDLRKKNTCIKTVSLYIHGQYKDQQDSWLQGLFLVQRIVWLRNTVGGIFFFCIFWILTHGKLPIQKAK